MLCGAPMLQPRALLDLVRDESLPPSAFGVRCQLAHLFRVLYLEPQADWRCGMPRIVPQGAPQAPSSGSGSEPSARCEPRGTGAEDVVRPSEPRDAWTGGHLGIAGGLGVWRNVPGLAESTEVSILVYRGETIGEARVPGGSVGFDSIQDFLVTYLARCLPMANKNELSIAVLSLLSSSLRRGLCSQR